MSIALKWVKKKEEETDQNQRLSISLHFRHLQIC